jgi:hypothetical protein
MTSFELALAIAHPLLTFVLASLVLRARIRARRTHSSRPAFVATISGIVACALVMMMAGARWWLRPDWPSLGVLSVLAATVLAFLWQSPAPESADRPNEVRS